MDCRSLTIISKRPTLYLDFVLCFIICLGVRLIGKYQATFNYLSSGPWNEGLIMGFVSKQKAEEYLTSGCAHGTFLLRIEEIDFVSCVRPMIMCRCNETDVF